MCCFRDYSGPTAFVQFAGSGRAPLLVPSGRSPRAGRSDFSRVHYAVVVAI